MRFLHEQSSRKSPMINPQSDDRGSDVATFLKSLAGRCFLHERNSRKSPMTNPQFDERGSGVAMFCEICFRFMNPRRAFPVA